MELLKLGNVKFLRKQIDEFFFGIIMEKLEREGWFDFLEGGKSIEDLAEHFGYTDNVFLNRMLETFLDDGVLKMENGLLGLGDVSYTVEPPTIFSESLIDIWKNHAEFIPNRLKGQYLEFTSGINLFNWDDALATKMYEQIRRSAFAFTGALKRRGKFLDVGCGNGFGTAAIWNYYYSQGKINSNGLQIHGIDPSEHLLEIAKEEFWDFVKKHNPKFNGNASSSLLPTFKVGTVLDIPYENNSFDMVYASQVLHWTDTKRAVEEMLRVTKPDGFVFGTQNFYPNANPYGEILILMVEGAGGFVSKSDFKRYAIEAGARKVEFSTPISVFKITK